MKKILAIPEVTDEPAINVALDTIAKGKQAIFFVNSKRGAEALAEKISMKVEKTAAFEALAEEAKAVIAKPTRQCIRLSIALKKGIAFHHAGLHTKQRELIEDNFRNGTIRVICATPTLAYGLDLPAFRVIVRDVKRFGRGGMEFIPVLEFEQMCVPGDTLIKTSQGDVPIKTIVESDDTFKVLTYDAELGKYGYRPVCAKFQSEADELIRFEMDKGFLLETTPTHPIYLRRGTVQGWVRAKDMCIGDEVLLTAKTDPLVKSAVLSVVLPYQEVYLPNGKLLLQQVKKEFGWSDRTIGARIHMEKRNVYHYKYGNKALPLEQGLRLSENLKNKVPLESFSAIKSRFGNVLNTSSFSREEFFWLVGIIATDGTLTSTIDKRTKSRYVKIKVGNTDERIIGKAKRILEEVVQGTPYLSERDDGYRELELGCTLLADILSLNFGIPQGKKSDSVRAPPLLGTAPIEYVGSYLAGVFDGDGSYQKGRRIHFATGSEAFAHDIQQLLLRLGIISSFSREKAGQKNIIRGKLASFKEGSYAIKITKKASMQRFAKIVHPVKCGIDEKYSKYHNIHLFHDQLKEDMFIKIRSVTHRKFQGHVFNIGVEKNNNYFANGILVHNCGRAGRPGKEEFGEAIAIAGTEGEKEKLIERYLLGKPEVIYSKLAVEPVLRTYILSIISSELVHDTESLMAFFEKTFYAHQFKDLFELKRIVMKMLDLLEEWEFIKRGESEKEKGDFVSASALAKGDQGVEATPVGKRVSELYLDPASAHHIISCMQRSTGKSAGSFSFLFLVARQSALMPFLRVKMAEYESLNEKYVDHQKFFLEEEPSEYSPDFEEFMASFKTALFFEEWCSEKDEEFLLESYDIRPGEIHVKLDVADWLLFCTEELARLQGFHYLINPLAKLRVRLQYGVKEELLPLLKFKNVGRARARALFNGGVKSIGDVRTAELSKLVRIVGPAIAADIKKQVGEKKSEPDDQDLSLF